MLDFTLPEYLDFPLGLFMGRVGATWREGSLVTRAFLRFCESEAGKTPWEDTVTVCVGNSRFCIRKQDQEAIGNPSKSI